MISVAATVLSFSVLAMPTQDLRGEAPAQGSSGETAPVPPGDDDELRQAESLDAFIDAVVAHRATDSNYVERLASQLLERGLVHEVQRLIRSYRDVNPAQADNAVLGFLQAEATLLQFELAQVAMPSDAFESPSEKLERDLGVLRAAKTALRQALRNLDATREEQGFDSQKYASLRPLFGRLGARILMSQGDQSYRLMPPSLSSQLVGDREEAMATVVYRDAREELYGSLLWQDRIKSRALAAELEQRLAWLAAGRFFGGHRYFEADPFMGSDQKSWTPLARLSVLMSDGERSLVASKRKWYAALERARRELLDKNKEVLAESTHARRRVQSQLAQLTREIAAVQLEMSKAEIQEQDYVAQRLARLRTRCFETLSLRKEYERQIAELTQQRSDATALLADRLNELSQTASREEVERTYPDFPPISNPRNNPALATAIENFDKPDGTRLARLAKELTRRLAEVRSIEASIQAKRQEIEANRIELDRRTAAATEAQLKADVRDLESQVHETLGDLETISVGAKDKIAAVVQQRLEERRQAVQREIDKVNKLVDEATGFIDDVEGGARSAQAALAAARAAIVAAGKIPIGIIGGTSNGIFTNESSAVIEAAKAGAEVVRQSQQAVESVQQGRDRLNRLKGALRQYEQQLKEINFDLVKGEIQKDLNSLEKEANGKVAEFKELILRRRQEIQRQVIKYRDFESHITRIRRRVLDAETQELTARRDGAIADVQATEQEVASAKKQMRFLCGVIEAILRDIAQKTGTLDRLKAELEKAAQNLDDNALKKKLEVKDEVQQSYDSTRSALLKRIELLERRRADLVHASKEDGAFADYPGLASSVQELSLSGSVSVKGALRDYQTKLDETNRLLFQFANWLYLLSRDPRAQQWAVSSGSVEEAKIVHSALMGVYSDVQRSFAQSNYDLFAVEMDRMQIEAGGVDQQRFYITVDPSKAWVRDLNRNVVEDDRFEELRGRRRFSDEVLSGAPRGAVTVYQPFPLRRETGNSPQGNRELEWPLWNNALAPSGSTVGITAFDELTFAPDVEREAGAHQVLWDVWVMPKWRRPERWGAGIRTIAIRPIGATWYRRGNKFERIPVIRRGEFARSAQTSDRKKMISAWKDGAKQNVDLTAGTFKGMNCPAALGRGLGNTWELTFPKGWVDGGDAPGLDDLESVVIYFAYITGHVKQGGDTSPREVRQESPVVTRAQQEEDERSTAAITLDELRAEAEAESTMRRQFQFFSDNSLTSFASFDHTPTAHLNRLRRLELGAALVPVYADLLPSTEEDEARREFAANVEQLLATAPRPPKASVTVKALTSEIIKTEVLSYSPTSALVGPVELHNVWKATESILSDSAAGNGLLQEVEFARSQLETANVSLQGVVSALDPIQRIVSRLDFERATSENQVRLAEAVEAGLKALAFNREVNKKLLEIDKLTMAYLEPNTWLWLATNEDVSGKIMLQRLELEFEQVVRELEERNGRRPPPRLDD